MWHPSANMVCSKNRVLTFRLELGHFTCSSQILNLLETLQNKLNNQQYKLVLLDIIAVIMVVVFLQKKNENLSVSYRTKQ